MKSGQNRPFDDANIVCIAGFTVSTVIESLWQT
jgi:hypothetical protein